MIARRYASTNALASQMAVLTLLFLMLVGRAQPALAVDFEDIQFWAGAGPHRAALVVDWSEETADSTSLVWGFRFDGAANGKDLLSAVLAADPRLFAKVGTAGDLGLAVYGLGYDWNADGELLLSDPVEFGADGTLLGEPSDGAVAADPIDRYAEGWFWSGFWNYATAEAALEFEDAEWEPSLIGPSSRVLADGSWDAWTFSPSFTRATADMPSPAPTEASPGDFDRDGGVTGHDLLLWQRTHGASSHPFGGQADGDFDSVVGPGDSKIWETHFGGALSSSPEFGQTHSVPEPRTLTICLVCALLLAARSHQRRRPLSRTQVAS